MSLRDYKGEKVAIWLAYFTADSRSKGRKTKKLPKRIDLNMLFDTAKRLGLSPDLYPDKIHPPSGIAGLIMVSKPDGMGKYKVIKLILNEINKQQGK